jgi:uncharacterized protein (TIGR00730 family)
VDYTLAAAALGNILAEKEIAMVYGGTDVGLMGEIANVMLQNGGRVIGVIPKFFADRIAHKGLTELHVVESMYERKEMMFELSDGFIALPGGIGTMEEVFEILTWSQLGLHKKPCGLLNVRGYFNKFLEFVRHAVDQQFIQQEHYEMIQVDNHPEKLLYQLISYEPPRVAKWFDMENSNEGEE